MHNSKYKPKIDKIKRIGIMLVDNLDTNEAEVAFTKIMNATIARNNKAESYSSNELEQILRRIKNKHNMYIGYILPVFNIENDLNYSMSLRLGTNHIDTVFARTLKEGLYKSLLVLYYYIRLKEDNKNE